MSTTAERPLRVLLVSHYYPPHLGGIEMVVRQEAVRLAAAGAEVTVVTSAGRGGVVEQDGVRVVRVAAWNGVERRTGVPFPLLSPVLLPTLLRWTRWADVVHLHDCLYLTSWAAGLAAPLTRTPYLLTQHVGLVQHPSAPVRLVQRAVYATAGRLLLRRARRVFTLNGSVAAFVRGLGARPERSHHLPNGVDLRLFHPADTSTEREHTRARFGLPRQGTLVLFAGRLVPKKGYQLLLDAAAGADYQLVLAGEGDTRPLADRTGVHHLGGLAPEELAQVYRACDVFALPSTAEGFPLTVQEAMASGLPVVTTDDPGYAPYRLDPSQALLIPRQTAALRSALDDLAGDPGRRADMGAAARRCAEARFAWETHVDQLLSHYRNALTASATVPAEAG